MKPPYAVIMVFKKIMILRNLKIRIPIVILYFFLFMQILLPCWAEGVKENSCVTCHSDMWEEMKDSVHSQHGISCNDCHGGDPTKNDQVLAKTPETKYIGVPDKKQIMEICGSCHSDVEKMNSYGIRTDQLARYKTSHHGKKLLQEGNTKVAVCTDCHGYHDVLNIADPNSTVYPMNLPKTCDRCHGNEKIMSPVGLPTDIFGKYKNSVHGKALFEKKDISVANCASCHGSHGAVPPGVKDVPSSCGKCHINEKTYYLESIHAKISEQEKFLGCVSCHSNHDVQPAGLNLYEQACVKCHQPESSAFQEGQKIWQLLKRAEDELENSRLLVKQAGIEGFFVEEESALLEEAKTKVREMMPLQHTLQFQKIAGLYAESNEKTKKINDIIKQKREHLKWRKLVLVPIWIFVLGMVLALWNQYKILKASSHKKE